MLLLPPPVIVCVWFSKPFYYKDWKLTPERCWMIVFIGWYCCRTIVSMNPVHWDISCFSIRWEPTALMLDPWYAWNCSQTCCQVNLQVCTRELQVSITDYSQTMTQSLITSSRSVGVFTIALLPSHLTSSPSTTSFKRFELTYFTFFHYPSLTQFRIRKWNFLSGDFNHYNSIDRCIDHCYITGAIGILCLYTQDNSGEGGSEG